MPIVIPAPVDLPWKKDEIECARGARFPHKGESAARRHHFGSCDAHHEEKRREREQVEAETRELDKWVAIEALCEDGLFTVQQAERLWEVFAPEA